MPWWDYIWNIWIKFELFLLQCRCQLFDQFDHVPKCEKQLLGNCHFWGVLFVGSRVSEWRRREERPEDKVLHSHLHLGRKIRSPRLKCPYQKGGGNRQQWSWTANAALHKNGLSIGLFYWPRERKFLNFCLLSVSQVLSLSSCGKLAAAINLQRCRPKLSPHVDHC